MNNEPVAWMVDGVLFTSLGAALNISFDIEQPCIPLYTHPVKELKNIVVASATCSCGKVMEVTNLQPVKELTDEEMLEICQRIGVDYGSWYIHEFARAILRKAQEK
jgi:hypothetical protein